MRCYQQLPILSDCGALKNHYKIKEIFYVLKMVHDILNSPNFLSYKDTKIRLLNVIK